MRWMLTLLLLLAADGVHAQSLTKDTRWQGTRQVKQTVRVEPGVVLTIAPGTRIDFAPGSGLEVAGSLRAEKVHFTGLGWLGLSLKGSSGSQLSDCTIEGARTGLTILAGSPQLQRLLLKNNDVGVELRQKTDARLSDSRFMGNRKVGLFVKDGSTARITGNRFENNGKYGAYVYHAEPAEFSGNQFSGHATGLMISHYGSDPLVQGNRFSGNEVAILVDRAARPTLRGNLLQENATALHCYRRADPLVEGNRFENNRLGTLVAFSSYPRLQGNDFVGNKLALRLEYQSSTWETERGAATRAAESGAQGAFGKGERPEVGEEQRRPEQLTGLVEARDNWWGEAGTRELEQIGLDGNPSFIADGRDTPTFLEAGKSYPLDRVQFAPWSKIPLTREMQP